MHCRSHHRALAEGHPRVRPDLRHDLSPGLRPELGSWQSPGDGVRWDRSFPGWERGPGAPAPRRGGEGRFIHPGSSCRNIPETSQRLSHSFQCPHRDQRRGSSQELMGTAEAAWPCPQEQNQGTKGVLLLLCPTAEPSWEVSCRQPRPRALKDGMRLE